MLRRAQKSCIKSLIKHNKQQLASKFMQKVTIFYKLEETNEAGSKETNEAASKETNEE